MKKIEKTVALISAIITTIFILQFSFGTFSNAIETFDNILTEFTSIIAAVGILIVYISIPLLILRSIWRFINS